MSLQYLLPAIHVINLTEIKSWARASGSGSEFIVIELDEAWLKILNLIEINYLDGGDDVDGLDSLLKLIDLLLINIF